MITSLRIHLTLPAIIAGCALLASSCSAYPYYCEDYSECSGGDGDGDDCPGQCVPLPPLDFGGPALLWMGREGALVECPPRAPRKVFEGHADLDDSNQCEPCECTAPACAMPSGLTASSASCAGAGTPTEFKAPAEWSGSCTSPATVASIDLGSVTLTPATARPCEPVPDVPTNIGGSSWGQRALACAGEAIAGVCGDPGMTCLPSAEPPPPGFRQCIMYNREGDPTCPEEYPEEYVFYSGLDDTRSCTACECTETVASQCAASLSLYQQQDCSGWLLSTMVPMGAPLCLDIPDPYQLGAMKAEWITNTPGSCVASGGVAVGEAKPVEPRAFCCQPLLDQD